MSHFLFSCVDFYTCGISLSDWSALLPLWHKHPVTTRWRGQPGHGKAWLGKGAVKLTDVCGTYEKHESCSKNRIWLMQFSQGVVQCQERLADVLGPINREPSPHSLQLPGWITAGWITAKWRMESHYVIPASAHTKRFMDKKLDKNIIPMVSMWTWSNYHVSPWVTARLLIWRFDQQNSG